MRRLIIKNAVGLSWVTNGLFLVVAGCGVNGEGSSRVETSLSSPMFDSKSLICYIYIYFASGVLTFVGWNLLSFQLCCSVPNGNWMSGSTYFSFKIEVNFLWGTFSFAIILQEIGFSRYDILKFVMVLFFNCLYFESIIPAASYKYPANGSKLRFCKFH